jgi:hypothetical protein
VASFAQTVPEKPELWYWHHSYVTTDEAVRSSNALIDRAAECGYTGVAFWDPSFAYLAAPFWPEESVRRLHEVISYATSRHMHVMGAGVPFGWSNAALLPDGNLAEASRIIGARFKVDPNGREMLVINGLRPLRNQGFEDEKTVWFDSGDSGIGISDVAHSGQHSGAIVDATGNARFRQKVILTPWRQYHVGLWYKTSSFHGLAAVEVQDWWHRKQARLYVEIPVSESNDWKKLDLTFNSRDTQAAYLYFGTWGGSSGILWFDDIQLEETAPVYVVRREGAPLRVYDPEDQRTEYREGKDFDHIYDPRLSAPKASFRDVYHAPVHITLPAGSRLRPAQIIAMDFYAIFPMLMDQQVGMCLTAPGTFKWIEKNGKALRSVMPAHDPVLLGYDELRQANSCAGCRAKGLTAGELLGWNINKTVKLYNSIMPDVPLYTWSDLFDPYHNAHDNYFYVEGNLAGSWKGLPSSVGVLNWDHAHLRESLTWFAGTDQRQAIPHKQIIASYYDNGKAESAETDLQAAHGIPGLQGIMYVTWRDDYTNLESFAATALKAWDSYRDSVLNTKPTK